MHQATDRQAEGEPPSRPVSEEADRIMAILDELTTEADESAEEGSPAGEDEGAR